MGMGMTTSSTTVTISGAVTTTPNLVAPLATQSLVNAVLHQAADGSTIYTVTAGKTFYCLGFSVGCNTASAGSLSVAGTRKISWFLNAVNGEGFCSFGHNGIIFTATAGQAITVTVGAANVDATLWGYEV